jgi:acyl-CoA synthetase (AMP-forming)/AMP-acid ligase II
VSHCNAAEYLLQGKDASRPALLLLEETCSYGQLSNACNRVASYLRSAGVTTGDRVVLIADNSTFWAAAYLGTLRAGLVCVPLPANIASSELGYVLANTEARFAFVQHRPLARLAPCLHRMVVVTDCPAPGVSAAISFSDIQSCAIGPSAIPPVGGDDLAALMFTSGSTGTPRGVMISHRNIIANTNSIVEYLSLTETDRIMTVLPFHYCFGTSLLHTHLLVGASLVIDPRFMYPEEVLKRMLETDCTGFAGVPSHYNMLTRNSLLRNKRFPKLRYIQQAGGRLAESSLRELRSVLPNIDIFVMYGQTEATARLSYLPPECLESKMGSIGKGIPGVTLRVLDESSRQVEPGAVGEIVAEGENIAQGYWRAPEETATTFRAGRLYTGDLATIDSDGFIYVLDRAKDFLKCAGKRVSSRQIEDRILQYEGLAEVAVIGISDDVSGEAVKAFVVPHNAAPAGLEEGLRAFCKRNLPIELVPKEIVVLNTLPRNSAGKISKHELRALRFSTCPVETIA